MIVDDRTPNLLLPLPNIENPLDADVERLRDSLSALDAAVTDKADAADLDAKADLVGGKVPANQLPSFVDDVLDFPNLAAFPTPGESGKIYIAVNAGTPQNPTRQYRWSGSAYTEITSAPGSTDAVPEGTTNKYFTDARARAAQQPATASAAGVVKVGAGVTVAGDGTISVPVPSTVGQQVYQAADQAAARAAIGAGTGNSNFSGAYADLSGKPTTVAAAGLTDAATLTGAQTLASKTLSSMNGGQLAGFRNKIQNGKMEIAQRGTSFAALASGSTCLDRWSFGNSTAAALTVSQQPDTMTAEFQSSLRFAVTTADTSMTSTKACWFSHNIEGYNVRDLIGRTFTLSFYARSSKIGVHCVAFKNSAADRAYIAEYTVNTANTWEFKTVTVTGGLPSSGTWNLTNGIGLRLDFALAFGPSWQATPNTWLSANAYCTANQVNAVDTVGNIFAVTGVQLEVGSVASPYEHRDYGTELAMCQRYLPAYSGVGYYGTGLSSSATLGYAVLPLAVAPRVPPTGLTQISGSQFIAVNAAASTINLSAVSFNAASNATVAVSLTAASGLTANGPLFFGGNSAGSALLFTGAEL